MDDVFSQLVELEKLQLTKEYYVYYNQTTGDVIHIKNHFDPNETFYPFIKVPIEDFNENFNTSDYVIIDKPKLINRSRFQTSKEFNDIIYRIPKTYKFDDNYDYDLLIEQDFTKNEFRFRLNDKIKTIYNQISYYSQSISLYLTDYNDPNILHNTFIIEFKNLVDYSWYTISNIKNANKNTDLYTNRYFQSYVHMCINK
jgi:hypothetical protein